MRRPHWAQSNKLPLGLHRKVREDICNRAAGHCEYCNVYVGMQGTIDHFWPLSRGGSWAYSNLRWACLACNRAKADMAPHVWAAYRLSLAFVGPPRETKAQARLRLQKEIACKARILAYNLNHREAQASQQV